MYYTRFTFSGLAVILGIIIPNMETKDGFRSKRNGTVRQGSGA